MREDVKSVRRRMFLEPPSSETDSFWAVKIRKDVYYNTIDLTVADCNRSIHLGFSYSDKRSRKAMLRKLDKLQKGLDIVKEALLDE